MASYIKTIRTNGLKFRLANMSTAQITSQVIRTSLETAIDDAKLICSKDDSKKDCNVAWDIVEELSATAANHKEKQKQAFKITPVLNKDDNDNKKDNKNDNDPDDYPEPTIDDSPIFDL